VSAVAPVATVATSPLQIRKARGFDRRFKMARIEAGPAAGTLKHVQRKKGEMLFAPLKRSRRLRPSLSRHASQAFLISILTRNPFDST